MESNMPYSHLQNDGVRPRNSPHNYSNPTALTSVYHENSTTSVVNRNTVSSSHNRSRRTITLGKPLPTSLSKLIQFLLGVDPNSDKQTVVGKVFKYLTIIIAICFLTSSLVYIHKDIYNDFTKTTVVDGTVTFLFILLWCVLGIYANGLAFRLYNDEGFQKLVLLPSKKILGINSALLLFILQLVIVILNNYGGLWMVHGATCNTAWVSIIGCKCRFVFRVAFSILAFIWHYLVTFVLVSVSRSFTIKIRQLMQVLEVDSRAYESAMSVAFPHVDDEVLLRDNCWSEDGFGSSGSSNRDSTHGLADGDLENSAGQQTQTDKNVVSSEDQTFAESVCVASVHNSVPDTTLVKESLLTAEPIPSTTTYAHNTAPLSTLTTPMPCSSTETLQSAPSQSAYVPQVAASKIHTTLGGIPSVKRTQSSYSTLPGMMSNEEILYRLWRLKKGVRVFGLVTQRWMLCLVSIIFTWLLIDLIVWLTTPPTLIDLANLILPILLLPLLAATYAEVNFEGDRLVRHIASTENRLGVLFFIQAYPLNMTIYGFTLSYRTITTAGFGVLVALATKVMLEEVSGANH